MYSKSVKKARILKVPPHVSMVITICRRSCCSWTVCGAAKRKETQTKPVAFLGFFNYLITYLVAKYNHKFKKKPRPNFF